MLYSVHSFNLGGGISLELGGDILEVTICRGLFRRSTRLSLWIPLTSNGTFNLNQVRVAVGNITIDAQILSGTLPQDRVEDQYRLSICLSYNRVCRKFRLIDKPDWNAGYDLVEFVGGVWVSCGKK